MNTTINSIGQSGRLAGLIACAALVVLGPMAIAQEQNGDGPHPAHIHSGTCDNLGDIVAPLSDVAAMTGETVGSATAIPVKASRSYVDLPLQDIIEGEYAVNVHLSADKLDQYIACGNIGGVLEHEGDRQHVIIGLAEQHDSGHAGQVWFGGDGERTEVVIILTEPDGAN